jgi:hypothetical protein
LFENSQTNAFLFFLGGKTTYPHPQRPPQSPTGTDHARHDYKTIYLEHTPTKGYPETFFYLLRVIK